MEKLKLYKVLKGLTSPYQNFKYKIGEIYHCPDIDMDKSVDYSRGLYAVDIDGLLYSWRKGYRVYECEVWGRRVEFDEFKRRYEYLKLVRYMPYSELKRLAMSYEDKVGYRLSEVLFPTNPFKIKPPRIRAKHIQLLKDWIPIEALVRTSVRASVKASVWNSVWNSVWDSVWNSVWDSVWDSVGISIRESVWGATWAYITSLFPKIKKWEYIQHEEGENPFQPCIDLWQAGLVPSFDGKTWRLHAGRDAEVVYELDWPYWAERRLRKCQFYVKRF